MSPRRFVPVLLLVGLVVAAINAQEQFTLLATVLDPEKGTPVESLTVADVRVTEDGEPAKVTKVEAVVRQVKALLLLDNGVGYGSNISEYRSGVRKLVEALPQMAQAASNTELRDALQQHLDETRDHRERIQHIFSELGKRRTGMECEGMKALISEGEKIINSSGDAAAKDAALIGAAQRVEHYEIAAYGTARTLAGELGLTEAETLLDQTLDEEAQADKLLTKIATGGLIKAGVNEEAR